MCIISACGRYGFTVMRWKFDFALSPAKRPFPNGFFVLFTRLICEISLEEIGERSIEECQKKCTFQVKVSSRRPLFPAMSLSFRSTKTGVVVSSESQIVSLMSCAASCYFFFLYGAQSDPTWRDVVDLAPHALWTYAVGDALDLHSVGQCGVQVLQHAALCIFRPRRRLSTTQRWRSEGPVEIIISFWFVSRECLSFIFSFFFFSIDTITGCTI